MCAVRAREKSYVIAAIITRNLERLDLKEMKIEVVGKRNLLFQKKGGRKQGSGG